MIRKSYVDGRWGQVHVREAGVADAPPVILLHQSPLSGAMFDPVMPLLAVAGLHAVAVDTAGFGMSDPPPGPVALQDHAEALGLVLDALGAASARIVGHHTGAAIGAAFAARYPSRVERLILNGVPLLTPEEVTYFRGFKFEPLLPEADGSHLLTAWNRRLAASAGWTDLDAMHKHCVEMLRINRTYHWGFQAALAHDMAPDLAALTCPTLILTNTGEDLYMASQRTHATRPDFFSFGALEGGTHDIVDEQPEAWARAVADFALG